MHRKHVVAYTEPQGWVRGRPSQGWVRGRPSSRNGLASHSSCGSVQLADSLLACLPSPGAEADLRAMHRIERNVASAALLKQVQQRRRLAKQASDASFRSGFASAIGGGASGDANGDANDGDGCAAAVAADAADAADAEAIAALTSASSWVIGIEGVDGYEWLTDCYRLRCDEEQKRALCVPKMRALGLCHLSTGDGLAKGFLTFCLLAAERGIIPTGWAWPAFLAQAAKQLPLPLSKGAAKSRCANPHPHLNPHPHPNPKLLTLTLTRTLTRARARARARALTRWGGENVFSTMRPGAMRLGGRSLVHTAELAYGSSCEFSRFPHDSREQGSSADGSEPAERARQVALEVRRSF